MEKSNLDRAVSVSKQLRRINLKVERNNKSIPVKTASPIYTSYPRGLRSVRPLQATLGKSND